MMREVANCCDSPHYFINNYVQIFDSIAKDWIPFRLWQKQEQALISLHSHQLSIWLKPRQVGCTWLGLAYGLWLDLFNPISEFLIFSLREKEAIYLLDDRLKGMYKRLPDWMKEPEIINAATHLQFNNQSSARAFPTGRGDSYTASFAMIDEADLIDDLDEMLSSIKPTIDAGGKLLLLSRVNKRKPDSIFKKIYKDAKLSKNSYQPFFIAWFDHPNRDQKWYDHQKRDALSLDDLYESYPATEEEALSEGQRGRIYPKFTYENVSPHAVYNPQLPVYISIDDGYTDMRAIGFWQEGFVNGEVDRVYMFAELCHTEKLAADSIRAIFEVLGEKNTEQLRNDQIPALINKYKIELVYHDPSAASLGAELQMVGFSTWGAYNNIAEGIKTVRRFVLDGNSVRRLLINPKCETAIESMMKYRTKEESSDGNDPKPVHDVYSHMADMTRYFIATRYFIQ